MKKLAIVATFALVFASAAPAYANTTTVVNSGTNATVNTTEVNNTSVNVSNVNVANVDQSLKAVNDTGHNVSAGNIGMVNPCNPCAPVTGGSSIVTGDATTNNQMSVNANSNVTAVDVANQNGGLNQTDVVNTGGKLQVNTAAVSNTAVNVSNMNYANVRQSAYVNNNTGWNASTGNIGASNIITGNAGTNNVMGVAVNENATAVKISGTTQVPTGCLECAPCTAANCTSVINSGKNANVNTASVTNTAVNVRNYNMLYANQGLYASNNSGHNWASNNVYGSNIVTGGAGTSNGMSVTGNSNLTAVSLDDSLPMGVNDLLLINSGANAAINTAAVANTSLNTWNFNMLKDYQSVYSMSTSGWNLALGNIGGGMTWTGNTGTSSNAAAGGNSNATSIGGGNALLTLLALMSL